MFINTMNNFNKWLCAEIDLRKKNLFEALDQNNGDIDYDNIAPMEHYLSAFELILANYKSFCQNPLEEITSFSLEIEKYK